MPRQSFPTSWERDGWDPWAADNTARNLALKLVSFEDEFGPDNRLGGGLICMGGGPGEEWAVIWIATENLDRPTRMAATLTHELIHFERGVGVYEDGRRRTWTAAECAAEESMVRTLTRWRMSFYRPAPLVLEAAA